MTTETFYVDVEKISAITVTYKGGYKKGTIAKDGKTLETFEHKKELVAGKTIRLPNKDTVFVRLNEDDAFTLELEVLYNGKYLPKSEKDLKITVKFAGRMIIFIGIAYILLGTFYECVVTFPFGKKILESMPKTEMPGMPKNLPNLPIHSGFYLIGWGILYVLTGVMTRIYYRPLVALHIALGFLVVEASLLVSYMFTSDFLFAHILARGLIAFFIFKGIHAIKAINQQK